MEKIILFPGQGSQHIGMGGELFDAYPSLTEQASNILGYSIRELCLDNTSNRLNDTRYAQPAIYVVNALEYLKMKENGVQGKCFLGHSLGEYNALLAAGAFDFETGLNLVRKRGELMAEAKDGTMAALIGLSTSQIQNVLSEHSLKNVGIANYNTSLQTIISGSLEGIQRAENVFAKYKVRFVPLNVNGAFHSRLMKDAQAEFDIFIESYQFTPLKAVVIANVSAEPYDDSNLKNLLTRQISHSVRWSESIEYLLERKDLEFHEVRSNIISPMVEQIKKDYTLRQEEVRSNFPLGNKELLNTLGLRYPYVVGGMYRGIASADMIIRLAKSGILGFFGSGGLSIPEIEENIQRIQASIPEGGGLYGMNFISNMEYPKQEMKMAELYLSYGIKCIEASAFTQVSSALVRYKLAGVKEDGSNEHFLFAKLSRPEVMKSFLSPAPEEIVYDLLLQNKISLFQAEWAKTHPICDAIIVEADSGGHTDRGVANVLFPTIKKMCNQMIREQNYSQSVFIGVGGGIGTPEAIASAFVLGADFVLTGSINQCTIESGANSIVKDMLEGMNIQDTDYVPAGDMFEMGSKVQVLKKGVLFPGRAKKLYQLYQQYDGIEQIPENIREMLEKRYFKKTLDEVWKDTCNYLINNGVEGKIDQAMKNGKYKMALIFKSYFSQTSSFALTGNQSKKMDYQIHTGSALGAFNEWVKETRFEKWTNRHVDEIGIHLMKEATQIFKQLN